MAIPTHYSKIHVNNVNYKLKKRVEKNMIMSVVKHGTVSTTRLVGTYLTGWFVSYAFEKKKTNRRTQNKHRKFENYNYAHTYSLVYTQ